MSAKLLKLSGAAFDLEYMAGQVRAHKMAVTLFEKESKSGSDADLKKWAGQKLPALRMHLKMASTIHDKLTDKKKGGGTGKDTGDR